MLLSIEDYDRLVGQARIEQTEVAPGSYDQDLLDRLPIIFFSIDQAFQVRSVNLAASSFTGRPRTELVGRRLFDLFPAFEGSVPAQAMRRVMRTGESTSFEAPSLLKGGTTLRYDVFAHGDGVSYFVRPIDDEVIARRLSTDLVAMNRLLDAHGEAGFARLGLRATFERVEPGFATLAGFSTEQLIGVRLTDILPPRFRPAVNEAIEAVFSQAETRSIDSVLHARDGREVPVRLSMTPSREGFAIDGLLLMAVGRPAD